MDTETVVGRLIRWTSKASLALVNGRLVAVTSGQTNQMKLSSKHVSASQIDATKVAILVDSSYSQSLYNFLRENGVDCAPPGPTVVWRIRISVTANGTRQMEKDVSENQIIASGTLADFERWICRWLPTLQ